MTAVDRSSLFAFHESVKTRTVVLPSIDKNGSGNPAIELREISKYFPGVIANKSISLEIRPGEIHALLGENGAGKAMLLDKDTVRECVILDKMLIKCEINAREDDARHINKQHWPNHLSLSIIKSMRNLLI